MPFRKAKGWGNIKPPVGAQVDWADPINTNLVGCWLMNEGGGARVSDIARTNHGVASVIPTRTPGIHGIATTYSGTEFFDTNNTTLFQQDSNFTISAWIKITGANGAGSILTAWNDSAAEYKLLFCVVGNQLFYVVRGGTLGTTIQAYDTHSLTYGQWYHVAFLSDRNSFAHTYINGKFSSAAPGSPPFQGVGAGTNWNYCIGAADESANKPFGPGSISQVSAWKRALTPTELFRLYSEPFAGIVAPRRRIISGVAAAPGGFKPAWVRRSSSILGGGVS